MELVCGILCLSFAALALEIIVTKSRASKKPASRVADFWIGSIIVPFIVGIIVLGIALFVKFAFTFGSKPFGWLEVVLVGLILVTSVLLFRSLQFRGASRRILGKRTTG